jgi:hypothetical protein
MNSTDQNAKLKRELAYLDIVICEKHYAIDDCEKFHEVIRLQRELDVLERRHHTVLTQLRGDAA